MSPGDPLAVAGAISRVLSDDDLAAELRREALAAAPSWGPERMLAKYRQAYQAAVAGGSYWAGGPLTWPPVLPPDSRTLPDSPGPHPDEHRSDHPGAGGCEVVHGGPNLLPGERPGVDNQAQPHPWRPLQDSRPHHRPEKEPATMTSSAREVSRGSWLR